MQKRVGIIHSHHWWIAILFAIALHASLLIKYQPAHQQSNVESIINNQVVINLKKLKKPLAKEIPIVVESVAVIPPKVPNKPKPISKKRPQVQPPKIVTPVLAPALKQSTPPEPIQQIEASVAKKKNSTATSAISDASNLEHEKTRYITLLARWLERHKRYPTIARRRNQEGEVVVKFVIDVEGRLLRQTLVQSSNHASLDTAASKMLERASPMPPVPAELRNGKTEFEYTIPVHFKLSSK